MTRDAECHPYWITFPGHPRAPLGIGVTAFSVADAFAIMEERGYTFHREAPASVLEDVAVAQLDQAHVVRNMGPIVLRGVWYPCHNVGFGAPGPVAR